MDITSIIQQSVNFNWDICLDALRDSLSTNNVNADKDLIVFNAGLIRDLSKIQDMLNMGIDVSHWQGLLPASTWSNLEYLISQWNIITHHDDKGTELSVLKLCLKYNLDACE